MTGRIFFADGAPLEFANVFSLSRPQVVTHTDETGTWTAPFSVGEPVRVSHVTIGQWSGTAEQAQLLQVADNVNELPGTTVVGKPTRKKQMTLAALLLLFLLLSDDD